MKTPVSYELNGRRRCLLVEDGETIQVGRGEACDLRIPAEDVGEVEMSAQFVNGCQVVMVHPAKGSVSFAQTLPWKLSLGGHELELCRPFRPEKGRAALEVILQGVGAGETRLVLPHDRPLLLGAGQACDVVIPDAGCPELLLAMWPGAGGKVFVQVLDDSAVVGWLGRAGEAEAELELPLSLSIAGRVILISAGDAAASKAQGPMAKPAVPALAPLPKAPGIQAKSADYSPKIVSRQAKPSQESKAEAGVSARNSEPAAKPIVQAAIYGSSPVVLPPPSGTVGSEDSALLEEPVISAEKPYSPTFFLLCSWLLVALMFAVALLPGQGMLTAEQMKQLWYAAGGTLLVTLVLGLGVMLK